MYQIFGSLTSITALDFSFRFDMGTYVKIIFSFRMIEINLAQKLELSIEIEVLGLCMWTHLIIFFMYFTYLGSKFNILFSKR